MDHGRKLSHISIMSLNLSLRFDKQRGSSGEVDEQGSSLPAASLHYIILLL